MMDNKMHLFLFIFSMDITKKSTNSLLTLWDGFPSDIYIAEQPGAHDTMQLVFKS